MNTLIKAKKAGVGSENNVIIKMTDALCVLCDVIAARILLDGISLKLSDGHYAVNSVAQAQAVQRACDGVALGFGKGGAK